MLSGRGEDPTEHL